MCLSVLAIVLALAWSQGWLDDFKTKLGFEESDDDDTTTTGTTAPTATTAPKKTPKTPKASSSTTSATTVSGSAPNLAGKTLLWKTKCTWYSSNDNTPCASAVSSKGKELVPYVSLAIARKFINEGSSNDAKKVKYGEWVFIPQMKGRMVKNKPHTGWLRVDDKCGDFDGAGKDPNAHCYIDNAQTAPKVDMFIGLFSATMTCANGSTTGPGGSGQDPIDVYRGTPTSAEKVTEYGVPWRVPGAKCNDCYAACKDQTGLDAECRGFASAPGGGVASSALSNRCWHWWPQSNAEAQSWCNSAGGK